MHERARKRLVADIQEVTSRGARRITCKRCGAPCLHGDDDDNLSVKVTVDEDPVDKLGELLAHLDGLATFDLMPATGKHKKPGQLNLWHRYPWHLDSSTVRGTVHAEHRCR